MGLPAESKKQPTNTAHPRNGGEAFERHVVSQRSEDVDIAGLQLRSTGAHVPLTPHLHALSSQGSLGRVVSAIPQQPGSSCISCP